MRRRMRSSARRRVTEAEVFSRQFSVVSQATDKPFGLYTTQQPSPVTPSRQAKIRLAAVFSGCIRHLAVSHGMRVAERHRLRRSVAPRLRFLGDTAYERMHPSFPGGNSAHRRWSSAAQASPATPGWRTLRCDESARPFGDDHFLGVRVPVVGTGDQFVTHSRDQQHGPQDQSRDVDEAAIDAVVG